MAVFSILLKMFFFRNTNPKVFIQKAWHYNEAGFMLEIAGRLYYLLNFEWII